MSGLLFRSDSCPILSFTLSSWSHTIGPQILAAWKPKHTYHSKEVASVKKSQKLKNITSSHGDTSTELGFSCMSNHEDLYDVDDVQTNNSQLGSSNFNYFNSVNDTESNLDEYIFLDNQNDNCLCSHDSLFKAVGQLLLGELENYPPPSGSHSRMFLSLEKDMVILTNLFKMTNSCILNKKISNELHLSLSAAFEYKNKDFIFGIYPIIDLMLRREVVMLQQFKVLTLDIVKQLTMHLNNICNMVSDLNNYSVKSKSSSVPATFLGDPTSSTKFLERSLTSHFQSCSCSTVIGENESDINKMINTLVLFQDERESYLSTYFSLLRKLYSYQPGLFIQGLLKDNYGKSDLRFHDLKFNPYPMTVIDLCQRKVRASLHSPSVCQWREEQYENQEEESSLQTVTGAGKLIPNMLNESRILIGYPAAQDGHARQFSRYSWLSSVSLIKITDRLRELNVPTTTQLLRTVLNQPEIEDLKVIIGSAEKLKPGICIVLNEK